MKDRLFILLSIVLIILFTARVLENMSSLALFGQRARPRDEGIDRTLTSLEERGLEPCEARFYRVIDE